MSDVSLTAGLELAVSLAERAGELARSRFGTEVTVTQKGWGDLVTEVDHACERILVDGIRSAFPAHHVWSEECGHTGPESEWSWLIDPLDGTNNYALGLPLYGCSVSLTHRGTPVLGVVHDGHHRRTLAGARGLGAREQERPLQLTWDARPNAALTIGWCQGYGVRGNAAARELKERVETNCKRVLATWSPIVDLFLLLTGKLDAFVAYDSELADIAGGLVLVPEAGGIVTDFSGQVPSGYGRLVMGHPEAVERVVSLLGT